MSGQRHRIDPVGGEGLAGPAGQHERSEQFGGVRVG
jgi:hypothetical protein